MLSDIVKKINKDEMILVLVIILTALIGFLLGRLSISQEEKFPIKIESIKLQEGSAIKSLVGSKNGAVYHLPSCPGAQQIKEENKIYFSSKGEAQKAGYRPAANCEGL